MNSQAPVIAIVGRPNVGKSTLFNRLVGGRPALVHDTPGLTRDRRYGECEYAAQTFRVIDTGGLDMTAPSDAIAAGIHRQAHHAMEEADAVVLIVDAASGLTPTDEELARTLRKLNKPLVCAVNKVDHPSRDNWVAEAYRLGLPHVVGISAAHGRGVDQLLELVQRLLAPPSSGDEASLPVADSPTPDSPLRVAFVGKPNAGKSSLVNRLLGIERSLVHDQPGTTTDPVDTPFVYQGQAFTLVDTAGIRRKARIDEDIEKISAVMALSQIRAADVCVLVLDGKVGASDQDARLAATIEEDGRALVVALNKADALSASEVKKRVESLRDELRFADYARMRVISAKVGTGVVELMRDVVQAAEQHRRRIATSQLNRFFEDVCAQHPPPLHKGRAVRIHYFTQARIAPPTFVLWANQPAGVAPGYRRFLANQLRQRYGFEGTPLRVLVRAKSGSRGRRETQRAASRESE